MRHDILAGILCLAAAACLAGCGGGGSGEGPVREDASQNRLSEEEAQEELNSLLSKIHVTTVTDPVMDIYTDEISEADALDDISTFPVTVSAPAGADVTIEIAAATELSSDAPDDWLNVIARNFNKTNPVLSDGSTVGVSVRKITSGEVVTYIRANAYQPQVFIPSNTIWGDMLSSSGYNLEMLTDRIAGNTAGILMAPDTYDAFIEKYQDATLANVIEASINKDIVFAFPNPNTSSTGINILTSILYSFDSSNPLSESATGKLLDYQKTAPPVAYTTAVLRNSAAKGVIDSMAMEEQAYANTPELSNYVYIPFGIRHDHPVYTFEWTTAGEKEAAQLFIDYALSEQSQKLATERGFNRHDDYVSQPTGLDGTGFLTAQGIWKTVKNGGRPVLAVFIADVSGSMSGEPLNSLKSSLISASAYIGSEHYVGLVSYSSDVTCNLPVAQFDAKQRAYFYGEVKGLYASGETATYDALLAGIKMIQDAQADLEEQGVSDAKPMIFLLSDGEQNDGYSYERVAPVVAGLGIPVYTIAYNMDGSEELAALSALNEVSSLTAGSDDITNQLRNLFNVEL